MAELYPTIPTGLSAATRPTSFSLTSIPSKYRGAVTAVLVVLAIWVGVKIFSCLEKYTNPVLTTVDPSTVRPWSYTDREGVHEFAASPTAAPMDVVEDAYTAAPSTVLDEGATSMPSWGDGLASPDDGKCLGASLNAAFSDDAVPLGSVTMPPTSVSVDLLPVGEIQTDDASTYAPKAIAGMNFLDPSEFIGVDTGNGALRNSSYDIRNVIPNPIIPVGPWNVSPILGADLAHKPLE
jgi:hypothetical protein